MTLEELRRRKQGVETAQKAYADAQKTYARQRQAEGLSSRVIGEEMGLRGDYVRILWNDRSIATREKTYEDRKAVRADAKEQKRSARHYTPDWNT